MGESRYKRILQAGHQQLKIKVNILMPFTAMDLVGQFILCKEAESVPIGWKTFYENEWCLGAHPTLPVVDIFDGDSIWVGWLLGWAISSSGMMHKRLFTLNCNYNNLGVDEQLESSLYDNGGRWAAIIVKNSFNKFYLDPSGSLSAVFCAEHQIVASTPSIIPSVKNSHNDINTELVQKIESSIGDTYYPFGLTPRRSVERLLPNHALDLTTWESHRHWPLYEIKPNNDVKSAVTKIGALLKADISTIAQSNGLHMPLTAGRDSRMLLACARDHVDNIVFYTMASPLYGKKISSMGQLNCQIGRKIAKKFRLRHVVLPFKSFTEEQYKQLLIRVGRCVRGPFMLNTWTHEQLEMKRTVLFGALGELGRSFHWRKNDNESSAISADDLLEKRNIPVTVETKLQAQQWLDSLQCSNALTIWGLAYVEQLTGSWFSPLLYGFNSNLFYTFPFSRRAIIEQLLELPTDYRMKNCFPDDLISSEWPELLSIPFNWPIGLRRYLFFLRRHFGLVRRLIPFG